MKITNLSMPETTHVINPLSPNGDQHQFSPNNIHTLPRDKGMRIYEMITKEKMLWSDNKFSQLILEGNLWRSVWRICMWILGLKGLTCCKHNKIDICCRLSWFTMFKRSNLLSNDIYYLENICREYLLNNPKHALSQMNLTSMDRWR